MCAVIVYVHVNMSKRCESQCALDTSSLSMTSAVLMKSKSAIPPLTVTHVTSLVSLFGTITNLLVPKSLVNHGQFPGW